VCVFDGDCDGMRLSPVRGEERRYIIRIDNVLVQLRGHCGIDTETTLDGLRLGVVLVIVR
jgi:hypothetical protein